MNESICIVPTLSGIRYVDPTDTSPMDGWDNSPRGCPFSVYCCIQLLQPLAKVKLLSLIKTVTTNIHPKIILR